MTFKLSKGTPLFGNYNYAIECDQPNFLNVICYYGSYMDS